MVATARKPLGLEVIGTVPNDFTFGLVESPAFVSDDFDSIQIWGVVENLELVGCIAPGRSNAIFDQLQPFEDFNFQVDSLLES